MFPFSDVRYSDPKKVMNLNLELFIWEHNINMIIRQFDSFGELFEEQFLNFDFVRV